MTQEEKELLLKDLAARLPYELKGKCEIDASYDTSFDTIYQLHKFDAILDGIVADLLFVTPLIEDKDEQEFANEEVAAGIDILDFKPYLRPISSMTEEEEKEFISFTDTMFRYGKDDNLCCLPLDVIDWLNAHHFDYRGLIEKGLALEAPEGM